jgi:hypothetical protein
LGIEAARAAAAGHSGALVARVHFGAAEPRPS